MVLYLNVLLTTIFDLWSEAYNIWFLAQDSDSTFRYILKKSRWMKLLFATPYTMVCLLLFSNVFCHNVFYFDQNLIYTRGPLFYELHFCAFLYFITGIVFLLTYRKVLVADKLLALICFHPWNLKPYRLLIGYEEGILSPKAGAGAPCENYQLSVPTYYIGQ